MSSEPYDEIHKLLSGRAKSLGTEAEKLKKGGLLAMAEKLAYAAESLRLAAEEVKKKGRKYAR